MRKLLPRALCALLLIVCARAWAAGPGFVGQKDPRAGQFYNVKSFGAVGDGVANDLAAVNAAILAAYDAGGGTVFFPRGVYLVNGALKAACNSVICLPQNAWTGSTLTFVPIRLLGEVPPTWGDYRALGSGVVIKTTTAGSGAFPAVISGRAWNASEADANWNHVHLTVENLLVRTSDNPTIGGINCHKTRRCSLRHVVVDAGVAETAGSSTAASKPTSNVYGVMMPGTANNGMSSLSDVTVTGYQTGIYVSDHARFDGFVMAARCLTGFHFENAAGIAAGRLYSYRNKKDIAFTGLLNVVQLEPFMAEVDTSSGTWTQRAIGRDNDLTDATTQGTTGRIAYKLESPGGVQNFAPTYTGLGQMFWPCLTPNCGLVVYTRDSALALPAGAATDIPWTTESYAAAEFTHSTSTNPDRIAPKIEGPCRLTVSAAFQAAGGSVDTGAGFRSLGLSVGGILAGVPANATAQSADRTYLTATVVRTCLKNEIIRASATSSVRGVEVSANPAPTITVERLNR